MKPRVQIGFTAGKSLLGAAIRGFEGEDVSHALLGWDDPNWETRLILGANANGLTIDPAENFKDKIEWWDTDLDLWVGLVKLRYLLNTPYDYQGIFGMAVFELRKRFGTRLILNSPTEHDVRMFCSKFVIDVINNSGFWLLPEFEPGSVDPGLLQGGMDRAVGHFTKVVKV